MATTTTNYGLTKPSYGDNADIAVINSNMDKIDAKMKEIEDAGGSGASTWAEVENKPFETVGSGLSVDESGALNVTGGGSGGSSVSWNQIQTSGSKIAEVTIDGTKTDVYAPTGGSGGGGSYTETLLANGTYSKGSSISLSENYDNFDELVFIDKNTNPDGYITNHIFKKSTLDYVVSNNYKLELYGYSAIFTTLTFVDNKTINILDGNGIIYKVYGVKY